jgi:hypothetical protein
MSDPSHAARWQSSALVVAALITTGGAVSSALIQTGWFGKSSTLPIELPSLNAPQPQAAFAGFIEPVRERSLAANNSTMGVSNSQSFVAPAMYVSRPLVSQESKKKKQDLIDWNAIPRFFESLK